MADARSLQPDNADAYELAISEATAEWWATLPVHLLDAALDPYACPAEWLDFLANTLSVDLWRTDWPELKKRDVIARTPTLQTIKTTIPGLREHLAIMDARIVDLRRAPQRMWLGPTLTDAELEAWYADLPQLRVSLVSEVGTWQGELYHDVHFHDRDYLWPDLGPTLQRRKAVLHDRGTDIPVVVTRLVDRTVQGEARTVERFSIPGIAGPAALFHDRDYLDVGYHDALERAPVTATVSLDRSLATIEAGYASARVATPSLTPIDVRPQRVPLPMEVGPALLHDRGFLDIGYWMPDEAARYLVDRIVFYDPARAAPTPESLSFWDRDRFGMPRFLMEILVDAPGTLPPEAMVLDRGFHDTSTAFLIPHDDEPFARTAEAIVAAKAGRDEIRVSLTTHRRRTINEVRLDGSASLLDAVPTVI